MLPERGCVLHGFTESAFFDVSSRRSGFVRCVCSLQSVRKVQGPWSWGQKSAHRRARKIRKCRFRFCGAVFEACCDRSCSKTRPNAKEIGRRGRPTDNVRPKVPCGRTGTAPARRRHSRAPTECRRGPGAALQLPARTFSCLQVPAACASRQRQRDGKCHAGEGCRARARSARSGELCM